MAINNRDDYDKLARILYPSIEASGNVYFGQTRKLTMDEILGKNNLNFESHIESFRRTDNESDYGFAYDSFFCWRLGPFHGSFALTLPSDGQFKIGRDLYSKTVHIINQFKECSDYNIYYPDKYIYEQVPDNGIPEYGEGPFTVYGTLFLKYEIICDKSVDFDNVINSGTFKSYSNSFSCVFVDLCSTNNFDPIERDNANIGDRNFYISYEDGHNYLYIQIGTTNSYNYYSLPVELLTLTAVNDSVTVSIRGMGGFSQNIEYSTDGGNNFSEFTINGTNLQLDKDSSVKFRGNFGTPSSSTYIKFIFTGNGSIIASGDVRSLNMEYNGPLGEWVVRSLQNYQCKQLFANCAKLLKAPNIGYTSVAAYCYNSMFNGCTSLTEPPILPSKYCDDCCYSDMFSGCTSLVRTPKLNASTVAYSSYSYMFYDCASLKEVYCYADSFTDSYITDWLSSTAQKGIFYTKTTSSFIEDSSSEGIPSNWDVDRTDYMSVVGGRTYIKNALSDGYYKYDKIVSSGSNSESNGRGYLNKSTLFSMLQQNPMLNNNINLDIYNSDGSLNQEIWGYKCFNSPVSFRNGIYGECSSLTTWPNSDYNYLSEHNYYIDQNDDNFALNELYGSYLSCPNKEMHAEYNGIDMYTPDGIITITPESAIASAHANFINIHPEADAGVIVSQSIIASKHSVLNTSNLSRLLRNSELNNAIPDRSAVVCTNTHTKVGIRDGEYHLSFTTNTAMLGSKSDTNAAYILAESTINDIGDESNSIIAGAEKILIDAGNITLKSDNILPDEDSIVSLGSELRKFTDIYTENLHADNIYGEPQGINVKSRSAANKCVNLSDFIGCTLFIFLDLNSQISSQKLIYPGDTITFYKQTIDSALNITSVSFINDQIYTANSITNIGISCFFPSSGNNNVCEITHNTSVKLIAETAVCIKFIAVSGTASNTSNIVYGLVLVQKAN